MSLEQDFETIKELNKLIQNKIQETDKIITGLNSEHSLIKENKTGEKQINEIEKQMQLPPFDISIL